MTQQYTEKMIVEKLSSYKSLKTQYILILYEFEVALSNNHDKAFIQNASKRMLQLYLEIQRLEFYCSLLSSDLQSILALRYIHYKSWNEIEREIGYSYRTIMRKRSKAISQLTSMYNYSYICF